MRFNLIIGSFLILAACSMAPLVYSEEGVRLDITVHPDEPINFQPAYEGENRALITVKAVGYPSESMEGSVLRFHITHLEGRGVINTGYPHMEGKVLLTGDLPILDNEAAFEYVFPIRGNYLLEAELLRPPSMTQIDKTDLVVHVKEPFFEIRNSIILLALLFVFGLYLGRIYGGATRVVVE